MKKLQYLVVVGVFAFVILNFTGCGIEMKKTGIENETKEKENKNENTMLPENYPEDIVPIIDGAKVLSSKDESSDDKKKFSVVLGSNSNEKDIQNFYLNVLEKGEGYKKIEVTEGNILFGMLEDYKISIGIGKSEDEYKSSITISLTQN